MKTLTDEYDVDRPFASIRALSEQGVKGLYHENAPGLGLSALLDMLSFGAGVNTIILVNNCEAAATHFTESDNGTFDVDTTTTDRAGTNAVQMITTAATDATQYIETKYINRSALPAQRTVSGKRQMDWRDTRYLGFWKSGLTTGEFGTATELKVGIVNDGTLQTVQNTCAISATEVRWCEIDMEAAEWSRDKVEAVRFYGNLATTNEAAVIDMITRYQLSYDRGPYYGCMFPVKSAEALSQGDTVAWSIDGLVKEAAAAVDTLGPVHLYKNGAPVTSATGNAQLDVWGIVPGVRIFIGRANAANTAGDWLEWAANGLYADVTTTTTEKGFAKGLEAAGEQYDDIFMLAAPMGASD